MKKLDSKTMKYIAKTYGRKFAGDESDPSASEVPEEMQTIPAGYDTSPLANPNVAISPEALAQSNVQPGENLDVPVDQSLSVPAAPVEFPNPAPVAQPTQAKPPTPSYEEVGIPDIEGALQEEKKANVEGAKAQAAQGEAEVKTLEDFNKAYASLPSSNDIAQQYKQKDDELYKLYESKEVHPDRVLKNMSTGQKITTGLSLILGGIGAGLTGQPNLAADMIDKAIQRDIEAQKNDQEHAHNLWNMNKEEYGTDQAANIATYNQLLQGVKYKLQQASSAAMGPTAIANAQKANALIDQKLAENRFKLSLMQPTSDSFGLDPAKKVQWLVPAGQQAKAFDEIEAAQNTTRNAPDIMAAFDQASKEVRPLTGGLHTSLTAFVPGIESPGQKSLHALLGPTFKDVENTVRQAAMDNMFKNTTPQFADDDKTVALKRKTLADYMTAKSAAPTASGYGINLHQYPSTNVRAAIPVAPGQRPEQPAVKTMNGVKYQQVQGGWKKIQ